MDYCTEHGLGFIPWFPLATGELTSDTRLGPIATKHGATKGQMALAWLLKRSPVILPIPGTSSMAHLEENTAAREVDLPQDDYDLLDRLE